ncbi:MAG TPA: hypothetical protein VLG27_01900 [Candidatus Saccharimonadia bacterium]|nr:hypothetical protein [Candidatus Saccharimonadia bacterium]
MKNKKPVRRAVASAKRPSRQVQRTVRKQVRRKLPTHRRFLAHPATIFTLLCVGVLIAGWTHLSQADTVEVTAIVPAQPLTQGAIITYPSDGAVIKTQTVDVQGTCPPNSYVNLTRNSIFSGSAFCSASQLFTIQMALSPGTNVLSAQDYNITDQPGPASPSVTITYSTPAPPIVPPAQVKKLQSLVSKTITAPNFRPVATSLPLLLTTNYTFKTFATGSDFTWTFDLEGGTTPYVLQIDWGDGQHSLLKLYTDPTFTISHTYKKAGYFPVRIHAVDAHGQQTDLQVAALIRGAGGFGAGTPSLTNSTNTSGGINFFERAKNWLWIIWPTYGVVSLMAVSYLLGERQEVHNLLYRRYRHRS